MNQEFEFAKTLEEVRRLAASQGNVISKEQLEEWKTLPSIAIITKTEKAADALIKKLPEGAKRLDITRTEYETGVMVGSAAEVKGLEFDGVIIADADEKTYSPDSGDAKLLYVALTRALHHMCVFHRGARTKLLA